MDSKKKCLRCCGAKKCALVIGWIQTVSSAVFLTILSAVFIVFVVFTHHTKITLKEIAFSNMKNQEFHVRLEKKIILLVTGCALMILAAIISFPAGVVLIQGIKKKNAKMLKIWLFIEFGLLLIVIVASIVCILAVALWGVILGLFTFFISLFVISFTVVNVHRQQLLGKNAGKVIHTSV